MNARADLKAKLAQFRESVLFELYLGAEMQNEQSLRSLLIEACVLTNRLQMQLARGTRWPELAACLEYLNTVAVELRNVIKLFRVMRMHERSAELTKGAKV